MEQSQPADWEDLTPVLRRASFYEAVPAGGYGPRYIQDFQLITVQSGQGSAVIAGEHFAIGVGDVLFYGPNTLHVVRSSVQGPLRLIGMHFLFCQDDLARINPAAPISQPDPFVFPGGLPRCPLRPLPPARTYVPVTCRMRSFSEEVVLTYLSDPGGHKMEKRGLLLLALAAWYQVLSQDIPIAPPAISHRPIVARAQEAILQNIVHPPTLAQLAGTAGLSSDHFGRVFKSHTGMSTQHFIAEQRLLLASRLLVAGRLNVGGVARAVGFRDPFYFSRLFARRFGAAPSNYRKNGSLI